MKFSRTTITALAIAGAIQLGAGEAFAAEFFTDSFDGPPFHTALKDRDGTYVLVGGAAHNTGPRCEKCRGRFS